MVTCLLKWNWSIICQHHPSSPTRVPLNPSIMVYDCNLNTRQTSDTSQYILFISQRYKLIISLVASGQSVTKHSDYLWHELSEGDFNFNHRLMELNLGCWKKLDKVCKFQWKWHTSGLFADRTRWLHSQEKASNSYPTTNKVKLFTRTSFLFDNLCSVLTLGWRPQCIKMEDRVVPIITIPCVNNIYVGADSGSSLLLESIYL